MQSFWRSLCGIQRSVTSAGSLQFNVSKLFYSSPGYRLSTFGCNLLPCGREICTSFLRHPSSDTAHNEIAYQELAAIKNRFITYSTVGISFPIRHLTTVSHPDKPENEDNVVSTDPIHPERIKFKRLDKTARHIMNILNKEEVEKVRASREIPDIKPGYIVQLKVEVPENKRRVSILKGIVIARRNAGLHTTFRLRRMVAGVGVESVFPLYSPNIKEMKVLDKKDVRRAKLYYLRDRMNPLRQK